MNRMPCRATDDPYSDYSDWLDGKGVFAAVTEEDPDADRDAQIAKDDWLFNALKSSLDPYIATLEGDANAKRNVE